MFRLLTAGELECRVGQVGEANGKVWASFLIYKDARVDQRVLDETVGPKNWKNSYEWINGNLYCTISIWDSEKGEWISKQNVGTESQTEKEKGQASDAFKRAGFNWGIGRELYELPKVYISLQPNEYVKRDDKIKVKPSVRLTVSELDYDENGKPVKLVLVDKANTIRYKYVATPEKQAEAAEKPQVESKTWNEIPPLVKAVADAENAQSAAELTKVWNAYKEIYGGEEDFIDAIRTNPNNPKKHN